MRLHLEALIHTFMLMAIECRQDPTGELEDKCKRLKVQDATTAISVLDAMDLGTQASVDTLGECATQSQILITELGICGQPKCYTIHVEEFFEKTESVP